jgi:tRNA-2-methylthio-N6-dimethylallyladenosine synthase
MSAPRENSTAVGGVYVRTFGCQMNEYDSERMAGILGSAGYRTTDDPGSADVIIVNTCSIREKPEQKTYSEIGSYRALKEKRPQTILIVAGCVAQQRGAEIIERFGHVDVVMGTGEIDRIDEFVADVRGGRGPVVATDLTAGPHVRPFVRAKDRYGAFVTVMQGCNNYCSYCIVPYVRGAEVSRPSGEVLEEVRRLVDEGIIEVTLLGQNVNSYRDEKGGLAFPDLLYRVASIPGVRRVRFMTSHPKDLSPELIGCYREIEPLCSHIHLPLQSGSDRILGLMNRNYTGDRYVELTAAVRKARPDISITTDIIVGFPGETAVDFEETVSVMERVVFDGAYSFKYSPRPGTKAAAFPDDVGADEKARRLSIVQELQKRHTRMTNRKSVNRVEEVLAVGPSVRNHNEITGRSRNNKVVNFTGTPDSVGSIVPVRIMRANNNSLWGEALR